LRSFLKAVGATLICGLFAAAAGFFLWFLLTSFSNHRAARTWVPVRAVVEDAGIHTSRTSPGTGRPIRSSRIRASYAYEYGGKRYAGSRVDFGLGSDNFSGDRRARQMAMLRGSEVVAWVDPADPARSVIDRSLPFEQTMFSTIFLLFPCGLGTLFTVGWIGAILEKLGLAGAPRFVFPLLGVLHGAPAFYPALFAPGEIGPLGWVGTLLFCALGAWGAGELVRRLLDGERGVPAPPTLPRNPLGPPFSGPAARR
jgi:hypothetical protein